MDTQSSTLVSNQQQRISPTGTLEMTHKKDKTPTVLCLFVYILYFYFYFFFTFLTLAVVQAAVHGPEPA